MGIRGSEFGKILDHLQGEISPAISKSGKIE